MGETVIRCYGDQVFALGPRTAIVTTICPGNEDAGPNPYTDETSVPPTITVWEITVGLMELPYDPSLPMVDQHFGALLHYCREHGINDEHFIGESWEPQQVSWNSLGPKLYIGRREGPTAPAAPEERSDHARD